MSNPASTITSTLDVSNLRCPIPVLRLKKALKALGHGSRLLVTGVDESSTRDIMRYCAMKSHEAKIQNAADTARTFSLDIWVGKGATC